MGIGRDLGAVGVWGALASAGGASLTCSTAKWGDFWSNFWVCLSYALYLTGHGVQSRRGDAALRAIFAISVRSSNNNCMFTYPPVGRCIYCDSRVYDERNTPPHTEHIIPEGLGGELILPQASCLKCEGATSSFEGTCLRRLYGPLRVHYGLPSKRIKDRPTTLPVEVRFSDTDIRSVEVPVAEHPSVIALIVMNPATLIGRGRVDGDQQIIAQYLPAGNILASAKLADVRLRAIAKRTGALQAHTKHPIVINEHKLMLAKIGHAYATAELGVDRFFPFLNHIIRRKDGSGLSLYVGSSDAPFSDKVFKKISHKLSIEFTRKGKIEIVVVRIRLFDNLAHPEYLVAVGRLY